MSSCAPMTKGALLISSTSTEKCRTDRGCCSAFYRWMSIWFRGPNKSKPHAFPDEAQRSAVTQLVQDGSPFSSSSLSSRCREENEQEEQGGVHGSTRDVLMPSEWKIALRHMRKYEDYPSKTVTAIQSRHEDRHTLFGATNLESCQGQSVEDTSNSHVEKTALGWEKPDTLSRTNTALEQQPRDSYVAGRPVPVQSDDQLPEDTLVILYSTKVERKSSHLHIYGVLVLLKTRIVRYLCDVLINEEVRNMLCKSGFEKDLKGWSEESFHTFDYGGLEYWFVTAETDCKRLLNGEDVAFEKCSSLVRDKFAQVAYPATITRKRDCRRKRPLTKDVLPESIPSLLISIYDLNASASSNDVDQKISDEQFTQSSTALGQPQAELSPPNSSPEDVDVEECLEEEEEEEEAETVSYFQSLYIAPCQLTEQH